MPGLEAQTGPAELVRLRGEGLACERGGRLLFRDLSLDVRGGELMALMGPNGVGKSSLLRMLAGLLRPNAGTVRIETPDAAHEPEGFVHYLGHLDGIKGGLSVRDNLAFWRRFQGGGGVLEEALEAVGLASLAGISAGVLSAGQRKRLALARLLVAPRAVWLLDEPGSALDAQGEAMLGGLLARHCAGGGLAVAATHAPLPRRPDAVLTLARA